MSSKTVDDRVVQMQFDNSKFEKNVQQTIGTIDKLKKSLIFKDSIKEMDDLDKSALGVSKGFDQVGDSLDGIASKIINLKNVFKFELFSRIANKVIDVAEKTVKSLAVDPILSGWDKYEEKITSVQTIMSATASTWEANAKAIGFAGTQMEFVNAQLDKLNWFSDETSFSFTDMTSNIGKFTSAGVDLDKAVTAMEGISVWAAKSGQNAQSASRAYYNLAQAMSVGSVKLMDWKSIENANMATMEFKQTAIETAEELKYLKKQSDGTWKTVAGGTVTVENFNEALKDEWFSSEVLMKTLEKYGKAATRLSEIYDEYGITTTKFLGGLKDYQEGNEDIDKIAKHLGMSVEELLPLFEELNSEEYKLSLSAFRAAQEAKTFTEVLNATKDAVSTGWMNTFEIIFGNYEQAKKLWSEMAEGFYNIFAEGGNDRNEILTKVMDSSFDKLMDKISSAGVSSEAFGERLKKVFRDSGIPIDEMIEKYGTLEEAMRHIANVKDYVIRAIESFIQPISDGANAILDATDKLEEFQSVVNKVIRGEFKSGKERVEKLTEAGYNYSLIQGLVNKVWEKNNHTWKDITITVEDLTEVMSKMSDEELQNLGLTKEQTEQWQKLVNEAAESGSDLDEILNDLTKKSGRELISGTLLNFVEAINIALDSMRNTFHEVFDFNDIARGVRKFLEVLYKFSEWLKMDEKQSVKFSRAFSGIVNIIAIFIDLFKSIIKVFFPAFSKGINAGISGIFDILAAFGDWTEKLREFFSETNFFVQVMQTIKDAIVAGIDVIKGWIKSFMEIPIVGEAFNTVADKIKKFVDFVKKIFGIFKSDMTEAGMSLKDAFLHAFSVVKKYFDTFIKNSPALKKLSDIINAIAKKVKEIADNVGKGFFTGLKDVGKKIFDAISNFVKTCLNKINELLGIHSPSKWFIDLIWNCAKGIAQGIIEVTRFVVDKITGLVKKVMDSILGIARNDQVRESFIDSIKKTWKDAGGIRAKLVDIFDKVVEYLKAVKDWIADAIHNIIDYFKSLNKDELKELLLYILEVAELIAKIKALWDIGTGFKKIGQAFEEIGDGISGFFKGIKQKNTGKTMLMFAVSVAIVVGSVIALSKLSGPELDTALEAVGVILLIMGGLLVILSVLSVINTKVGKMKLAKGERAGLASNGIAGFALLILSLSASIAIILYAVKKYQELESASSTEKVQAVLTNIIKFIAFSLGIIEVLTLVNSAAGAGGGVIKAVSLVLALCLGLVLIIKTIEKTFFKKNAVGNLIYDSVKAQAMADAFKVIAQMLFAISASLALIAAANGGNGKGLKGVTLAVLAMMVAVIVIIKMVTELTTFLRLLDAEETVTFYKALKIVAGVLIGIAIALAVLSAMISNEYSAKGLLSLSLFLTLMVGFVAAISYAVYKLRGGDIKRDLVSAGIIIGSLVAVIVLMILLLNKLTKIAGNSAKERVRLVESLLISVIAFITIIGVMAAGVAYALYKLRDGDINRDLVTGGILIGSILVALIAVVGILHTIFKIVEKASKAKITNAQNLLLSIVGLIAVLAAFALAIAGVIHLIQQAGANNDALWASGLIVFGSMALVVGTIFLLIKTLEKMSTSTVKNITSTMWAIAGLVAVIGIVIGIMAALTAEQPWAALSSGLAIAAVMAVILGIILLFNKLNTALNTGLSIGLMLSVAAAVGIIAFALYELSKADITAVWNAVGAISALIIVMTIIMGILAAIASSGYGAMALAIAEVAIGALAALGFAIGYVIDQLTDLMIVIGVMAYGPDFAAAVATAFSAERITGFGDATSTTAGVVNTAAGVMATAFGGVATSIQDVINKGVSLGSFNWDNVWDNVFQGLEQEFTSPSMQSDIGYSFGKSARKYIINKIDKSKAKKEFEKQQEKDISFLTYDSSGNVRVFEQDRQKAYNQQEEERRSSGTPELRRAEAAEEKARKNIERINELKRLEAANGQEWMAEYLEKERVAEESRLREINAIEKARKNLEKTKASLIGEEASEAGKQGSVNFVNSFIAGIGDMSSGANYSNMITNLTSQLGTDIGSNLSINGFSLNDMTDVTMLGQDLGISGTDGILGSNFLTGNSAITDIQNNQGSISEAISGLATANNNNNNILNEMMGYWQTIAGNSEGTVDALNGMGVYIDGNAVGQVMSPIINKDLYNKYVGGLRGQAR